MLNHINIITIDIQRSIEFYESFLGAEVALKFRPTKVAMIIDTFEFFIEEVSEVNYHPKIHIGYRTDKDNLMAFYEKAKELGLPFIKGSNPIADIYQYDDYRTAFYVSDPDGLSVEVYTPDKFVLDYKQSS